MEIGIIFVRCLCLKGADFTQRRIIIGQPVISVCTIFIILPVVVGNQPCAGGRCVLRKGIKAVIPSDDRNTVIGILGIVSGFVGRSDGGSVVYIGGIKIYRHIHRAMFHNRFLDAADI